MSFKEIQSTSINNLCFGKSPYDNIINKNFNTVYITYYQDDKEPIQDYKLDSTKTILMVTDDLREAYLEALKELYSSVDEQMLKQFSNCEYHLSKDQRQMHLKNMDDLNSIMCDNILSIYDCNIDDLEKYTNSCHAVLLLRDEPTFKICKVQKRNSPSRFTENRICLTPDKIMNIRKLNK